jgi:hypothetical protein
LIFRNNKKKKKKAKSLRLVSIILPSGGRGQEDSSSKPEASQAKRKNKNHARHYLKTPTQKRAGRVAQVVEHLPSKHEVLNSNPSTAPIKKTKANKGKEESGVGRSYW